MQQADRRTKGRLRDFCHHDVALPDPRQIALVDVLLRSRLSIKAIKLRMVHAMRTRTQRYLASGCQRFKANMLGEHIARLCEVRDDLPAA